MRISLLLFFFLSYAVKASSCLNTLRLEELRLAGKNPQAQLYRPADYREGEKRDLLLYLHGLGSSPQSFERSGLAAELHQSYIRAGVPDPIVLSISMGAQALAGVAEHGSAHPFFVPAKDYWVLVEETLKREGLESNKLFTKIFILANSAGAFNAFQMLRVLPETIHVEAAVFYSFPLFSERGLGPDLGRDAAGTALRAGIEPLIQKLMLDPFFHQLRPQSILSDGTFPRNIPLLIQGGEFDAFAYTELNLAFVAAAQVQGLPLYLHVLPAMGHFGKYDHDLSVDFFQHGRDAVNP